MSVCVIVPRGGDCPHRERAWKWLKARYAEAHPDWDVVEAPGPDPWIKAEAVNPAVAATDAEIVVVADADVWSNGIERAVYAVACGEPWAMPHGTVHRLTEAATTTYIAGADPLTADLDRRAYQGVWGGGIVVAPRLTLLDVPMDPRFVGWGGEDVSWAIALHVLAGPGWRGTADLIHLWHPPEPRLSGKYGSHADRQLRRRYAKARRTREAMRSLIDEVAHVSDQPHQSAVHDRAAA